VVTTGEFVAYIEANQNKGKSRDSRGYVDMLYEQFGQDLVMKYEESKLPEKYPEFRYIYQEYHDGILLFDIMDQRVWSKAVSDTVGLAEFHQKNMDQYMWPKRADAFVVTCGEGVDIAGVRKSYKKILKGKLDEKALNLAHCPNDTVPCITLSHEVVEQGENELVDALKEQTGLGPVVESDSTSSFVILKKMRSPEPKKLNEARGQITSDYQNYLEKEWIKVLKQKYPVEVDESLLSRIKS
jgi:peptidyl-prolyl cis-trans isomerase SurA